MNIYRKKNFYDNLTFNYSGTNSRLYINEFNLLDKVIIEYDENRENKNNKLLKRQKNIKNTSILLGNLYINNICFGAVLPFFDNHDDFSIIQSSLDYDLKFHKLNEFIDNVTELENNFIYPQDITCLKNTLISKSNGKIELIDLTDFMTDICDNENNYLYGVVNKRLKLILLNTLTYPLLNRKVHSYDDLNKLNINENIVNIIKNVKTNEELKEFNELTYKDKVFSKILIGK